MTTVYFQDGKPIIDSGNIGISESCCCCPICWSKTTEVYNPDIFEMVTCEVRVCDRVAPDEQFSKVPNTTCCEGCLGPACIPYTCWRIIDQNEYVYAKGPISDSLGFGILLDCPYVNFRPLFYDSVGEKNFKLQAACGACELSVYHTLAELTITMTKCLTIADLYGPGSAQSAENITGVGAFSPTVPWGRKEPCATPKYPTGNYVCDNTDPPSLVVGDCGSLTASYGEGQDWRDPDHTVAATFTGAIDGEWTNLANWQDSNGNSPARYLPGNSTNVTIQGSVTSVPSDYAVSVMSLNISGGSVSIPLTCNHLNVTNGGSVGRSSICENMFGQITYLETCTFNGGTISGEVTQGPSADPATFTGSSIAGPGQTLGIFNGSANFYGNSSVDGYVSGGVVNFYNTSSCNQFGILSVTSATFYNYSHHDGSMATSDCTFNDNSYVSNTGTITANSVVFEEESYNDGSITTSSVSFTEDSENNGTVTGGSAPISFNFSGNSVNNGTVTSGGGTTTVFSDFSYNDGSITDNAEFNNNTYNSGTVGYDAIFTASSFPPTTTNGTLTSAPSSYIGTVNGTITFSSTSAVSFIVKNNDSWDLDSSGWIFSISGQNWTFNNASLNTNIVSGNSIFNSTSNNTITGTVNGDSSFNDSSKNYGSVIGTATFNDSSCNGITGTAGVFVPDPPPACP